MNKGQTFEDVVFQLYKRKEHNVKKQVKVRKKIKGHAREYVTFDIIYGIIRKKVVECKYRRNKNITASDIAKFATDMKATGIKTSLGEFVTNTSYTPQAVDYARMYNIRLIDGERFKNYLNKRFGGKKNG